MDSTENIIEDDCGMDVDDGIEFPEEMLEWDVVDEVSASEEDVLEDKMKETAETDINAKSVSPSKAPEPIAESGAKGNVAKDSEMIDDSTKEDVTAEDKSLSESPKMEQTTTRRSNRTRAATNRQTKASPTKPAESPKTTKQTKKGNTRSQKLVEGTDKASSDGTLENKPETTTSSDKVPSSDTTDNQPKITDDKSTTEVPAEAATIAEDTNVESTQRNTDTTQSEAKQDLGESNTVSSVNKKGTNKAATPKKGAPGKNTKKTDTIIEKPEETTSGSQVKENIPESKSSKTPKKGAVEKKTEDKSTEEKMVDKDVVSDEKDGESPSKSRVTRSHVAKVVDKSNQKDKVNQPQSSDVNVDKPEEVFKSPAQVSPKKNTGTVKGVNKAKTSVNKSAKQISGNSENKTDTDGSTNVTDSNLDKRNMKSPEGTKPKNTDSQIKKTDDSKAKETAVTVKKEGEETDSNETPTEAGVSSGAAVKTAVSSKTGETTKEKSSEVIVIDSDTDDEPKKTLIIQEKNTEEGQSTEPLKEITAFSQLKTSPIEVSVEIPMRAIKENEVYVALSHSQSFKIDFSCRPTRLGKVVMVYKMNNPERKKIILKSLATLNVMGLDVKVPRLLEATIKQWEKRLDFKMRHRKGLLKKKTRGTIKEGDEPLKTGHPMARSLYVGNIPIIKATNMERKLKELFPKAIRVCLAKVQGGLLSGWAVVIFPDKDIMNEELEEKNGVMTCGRSLTLSKIKTKDKRIPDTMRMRHWLWGEPPSPGKNKDFKSDNLGPKQFGRGGLMKAKIGGQRGMGMQKQGPIGPKLGGPGMNQGIGGQRIGQNMGGPGHIVGGPGMGQAMVSQGMGPNMGGPVIGQNLGGPGMGQNMHSGLGMGPNVSGPGIGNPGVNPTMSGPGQNMRGPGMGPMMTNMGPNIGGPGMRPNTGGPNTGQPIGNQGAVGNPNMNRPFSGMGQNMGGFGNLQNMGQPQNLNLPPSGNVPLSPSGPSVGRFSDFQDQREQNRNRNQFEGRDRRFSGGQDQGMNFDRESRTSKFDERDDRQINRGFSRERDIDRESNRSWDQDRGVDRMSGSFDRSREGQFDDFVIDREGDRSAGLRRGDTVVKNYDHTSQVEDFGKTVVRDYGHGKLMDRSPVRSKEKISRQQKYDRASSGKRQRKSEDRSSDREYSEQKGKKDKGGFEKTLSEKLGVVLSNERHGVQDDRAVVALLQTALNAMQKGSSPSPERSPPRFKSPDRRGSPPPSKHLNSGGMKRKLPQDDKFTKDRNRKFSRKSDPSPKGDFRSQQVNKGRGNDFSSDRVFSRGGVMRGKGGRGGAGNWRGSHSAAAGSESQFQNQNRPQQQYQNRPQGFSGNQVGDMPFNQNFQSQNQNFQPQGSFGNQYGNIPQNVQSSFNQPVFGQQGMQQNPRENFGGYNQGGQQGFQRYN